MFIKNKITKQNLAKVSIYVGGEGFPPQNVLLVDDDNIFWEDLFRGGCNKSIQIISVLKFSFCYFLQDSQKI